jgi:hypothetical protein
MVCFQLRQHLPARYVGQMQVEQNQIGGVLAGQLQTDAPTERRGYSVYRLFQIVDLDHADTGGPVLSGKNDRERTRGQRRK